MGPAAIRRRSGAVDHPAQQRMGEPKAVGAGLEQPAVSHASSAVSAIPRSRARPRSPARARGRSDGRRDDEQRGGLGPAAATRRSKASPRAPPGTGAGRSERCRALVVREHSRQLEQRQWVAERELQHRLRRPGGERGAGQERERVLAPERPARSSATLRPETAVRSPSGLRRHQHRCAQLARAAGRRTRGTRPTGGRASARRRRRSAAGACAALVPNQAEEAGEGRQPLVDHLPSGPPARAPTRSPRPVAAAACPARSSIGVASSPSAANGSCASDSTPAAERPQAAGQLAAPVQQRSLADPRLAPSSSAPPRPSRAPSSSASMRASSPSLPTSTQRQQ